MNIIVAYRQSQLSTKMIEMAIEHAKAENGKIFLITSVQQANPQRDMHVVDNARKALENEKKFVESKGIACEVKLIYPGIAPGEDVVKFAKEKDADAIIVGIQNKSKVGKFLLGSTAQDIIMSSHCPVITVKL